MHFVPQLDNIPVQQNLEEKYYEKKLQGKREREHWKHLRIFHFLITSRAGSGGGRGKKEIITKLITHY